MAEAEWAKLKTPSLTSAYHAFLETHVDGEKGFLLGRSSENELNFYWIRSAYQNAALNTSPQIDTLIELHREWIHGFIYGLSRKIRVTSSPSLVDGNQWVDFTLLLTY